MLKLAIIGATGSALKRTIPALKTSTSVEVVAAQARNPKKLEELKAAFGIPHLYTSVEQLVSEASYDAIYVATPPFLHEENILAALASRKPVVCEKPLAHNLESAIRIERAVRDSRIPFMLAHHLRHQHAITEIKEALASGLIGSPVQASFKWTFALNRQASSAQWKLDPIRGGTGPFYDAGVHLVDLALYLFGRPDSVFAHSFNLSFAQGFDCSGATLAYSSLVVNLFASQVSPPVGNHLLIYGTKGSIEAFDAIGEKAITSVRYNVAGQETVRQYEATNLYGVEVENFAASLTDNTTPFAGTSLEEAVVGMRILSAIEESAVKHTSIEISK
jgi:predicted dehydrogenase